MKNIFKCELCNKTFDNELTCRTHESTCGLTDENEILAIKLHDLKCNLHDFSNTKSPCLWYTEIKNGIHIWDSDVHNTWLGRSKIIKPQLDTLEVSVDKAFKIFELLSYFKITGEIR